MTTYAAPWRRMILAAACALIAAPVVAQESYPSRPIHVIFGFPAGGGADITARHFLNRLEKVSGKTFVLDNKPGNAGNLALAMAATAKPDGYTLTIGPSSNMVGARFFFKEVKFDPTKDFVPIGSFTDGAFILLTGMNTPAKTLPELTAWLKSRPQNRFAYSNQIGQLASEYYKNTAGFPAVAVAYRSGPEAYADVQAGMVEYMVADATTSSGHIKANRMRAIATTTAKRLPVFPDLPTMRELGFPEADFSSWFAMYAPAGTDPAIVAKLGQWLREATAGEETEKFLSATANTTLFDDSQATAERLKREITRWEPIVKAAGIEPQ